jgi:hypothetical protein
MHNAALLFRKFNMQGYQGSTTIVQAPVSYLRTYPSQAAQPPIRKQCAVSTSPREIYCLLAREKGLIGKTKGKLQWLLNS